MKNYEANNIVLSILTYNICSLISDKKKVHLQKLIDEFKTDAVTLQETWSNSENTDPVGTGMSIVSKISRTEKTGGGIMTLVDKAHQAKTNDVKTGFKNDNDVQITKTTIHDIILYNVYRTPCQGVFPPVCRSLFSYIENETKSNKEKMLIFCGDFNLPTAKWNKGSSSNGSTQEFMDICQAVGLKQMVTKPTRKVNQSGTQNILDLVLTNKPSRISCLNVHNLEAMTVSDHFPITFKVETKTKKPRSKRIETWDYAKADFVGYKGLLMSYCYEGIFDYYGQTLEKYFAQVEQAIWRAWSLSVPRISRVIKIGKYSRHYSKETKLKERETIKKYQDYLKNHKGDQAKKLELNRMMKEVTKSKKRDKIRFQEKLVMGKHGTKDNINRYVDNFLGKTTKLDYLIENGNKVTCDKEKANVFAGIYETYYSPYVILNNEEIDELYDKYRGVAKMKDSEITEKEVLAAMSSLNKSATPGKDGVLSLMFTEAKYILVGPITKLCQLCLNEGKIPSKWRTSIVSPIYKKGSKTSKENYRPVSVISNMMKIVEKVVAKRIDEHMTKNNLWSKFQFAFRAKRGVEGQHISQDLMLDSLLGPKDSSIGICLVDAVKAYDRVSFANVHRSLIQYGICPKLTKWILDCLMDRRFVVKIGDQKSREVEPSSGFLQGSSMSCTLFNLIVNDAYECVPESNEKGYENKTIVLSFADDLKAVSCLKNGTKNMQETIDNLVEWSKKKTYEFHPTKTQWLQVTKNKNAEQYELKMGTKILEKVEVARDLGKLIQNNGTSDAHFAKLIVELNIKCDHLKTVIKSRHIRVLTTLWHNYFESKIRFCLASWGLPSEKQYLKLCSLQKRFFRVVIPCVSCQHYERKLREVARGCGKKVETLSKKMKNEVKCPRHRGPNIMRNIILNHFAMVCRDIKKGEIEIVDLNPRPLISPAASNDDDEFRRMTNENVQSKASSLIQSYNSLNRVEKSLENSRNRFKKYLQSDQGTFSNELWSNLKLNANRLKALNYGSSIKPYKSSRR